MKILTRLAVMVCLCSFAIDGAIAQPTGTRFTRTQIDQLKSLGIKIAAPSYIPSGFRIDKVKVEPCPKSGSCRFGPSYVITYRGQNNSCFAIESTGGGIGGAALTSRLPINSRLFGSKYGLNYGKFPGSPNFGETIFSDWMEGASQFYRFAGAGAARELSNCKNISPREAVRVTESLQYLNP